MGTFSTNASAWGRDAGNSGQVGDRIVWIFGDTLTPSGLRTATAGWANVRNPFSLEEAVDKNNAPYSFFPFTAEEVAFNEAHAQPPFCCFVYESCPLDDRYCKCPPDTDCAQRIAMWPGDVFEVSDGKAIVYYDSFVIGVAAFDFRRRGTGLAKFEEGSYVSARILEDDSPLSIFAADEPPFSTGLLVEEAGEPTIYLFAATNRTGCFVDILVSRVKLTRAADRDAYTFWNGTGWVGDVDAARPILEGIQGGLGSVMWNDYLGLYLSGFSDLCTGGSEFVLRTAPRPEGPWSEPLQIDLSALAATSSSYAGMLHPELGNRQHLVISFYAPNGAFAGELRLALLTLR